MSQKFKNSVINAIVLIIVVVVIFTIIFIKVEPKEPVIKTTNERLQDSIEILKTNIKYNETIVDSLKIEILKRESTIDSLENLKNKTEKIKLEYIKEIRKLPVNSGVEFLTKKLKEYEEKYNKKDII